MKRILALLLVLLMCLPLAACEEEQEEPSLGGVNGGVFIDDKHKAPIKQTYTVHYENNGGNGIIATENIRVIKTPSKPYKENHVFVGWFCDQGLTQGAVFPLELTSDITLYAKWLKIKEKATYVPSSLKDMDKDYPSNVTYSVNAPAFDFDALAAEGYSIDVTLQYDIHYYRDCVAFYVGGPKYEEYWIANGTYYGKEDIPAPSQKQSKTVKRTISCADMKKNTYMFQFSTNNVQNVICFENISITFECKKYK